MKRIDDKIKEIEKKDKTNRILYIAFVVLIGIFMATVFIYQGKMDAQQIKLSGTYKDLEKTKDSLKDVSIELNVVNDSLAEALETLNNSLDPEEYWEKTLKDNLVESYISYITNEWGIKKTHLNEAIANIQTLVGLNGWLYTGNIPNSGIYESGDVVEVVWRKEGTVNIKNSEPQVGDIVKLITPIERLTYNRKDKIGKSNFANKEAGWRPGSKGYITEIYKDPDKTDFNIKIKYY